MDRDTGSGAPIWQTVTLAVTALAGVATLVALIWTLAGANRQRDLALDAQAHSYDVMILARSLAGSVARSEASLGRYVISGDQAIGQTFVDQWTRAGAQLDRLDRLTGDNAGQQRRIDRLRAAYAQRDAELSLIARSTDYGKNAQALGLWWRARKAPALARIDRLLEEVIARERQLLDRRSAAAAAGVERASRVAGGLALAGVLLVLVGIAAGWLAVQASGARLAADAAAAAEHARAEELAVAVAAATAELRAGEAKLRQGQKMEAIGQLTGGIAHDFNNMLAVVIGGLELAGRQLARDPAVARRHLDHAREGADRAAALTRRLLAFSREEALRPEAVEPGALVAGMTDLLDRTLGDGVRVVVLAQAPGRRVRADRVQLENALLNLAVNARDAMDGRGTLTLATRACRLADGAVDGCPAGDYLAVAVTDTGHGMTPAVAERVFEPFFTTKEAGRGTGLGLSQLFALVRQLGGGVALDTAPGRGTTVTLFLPEERAAAVDPAPAPVAAAADAGAAAGLLVLVVEDDPRVLAATAGALRELGHRVVECADPLVAPALLDAAADGGRPMDLIVSDVLMPGRTGPEMVAALPPAHAATAVLFVTGFAGEAGAQDLGGRPVLRKPFTLAALARAVGEAAGAPRLAAA